MPPEKPKRKEGKEGDVMMCHVYIDENYGAMKNLYPIKTKYREKIFIPDDFENPRVVYCGKGFTNKFEDKVCFALLQTKYDTSLPSNLILKALESCLLDIKYVMHSVKGFLPPEFCKGHYKQMFLSIRDMERFLFSNSSFIEWCDGSHTIDEEAEEDGNGYGAQVKSSEESLVFY